MGKKEKVTLFHWRYDDTTTCGSIQCHKKGYERPLLLKNESEVNKENNRLVEEEKQKNIKIKVECLDLPVAKFKYAVNRDTANDIDCFRALVAMTQPNAHIEQRGPIVQLVAVILSSYLIRPVLEMDNLLDPRPAEASDVRALYASVTCSENAYSVVRKIGEATILPMVLQDEFFKAKLPRIIPHAQEREILSCAWLKVRGSKDFKWPAHYRDTAVILDQRFLKRKDVLEFYKVNPWCTSIIYDGNQKLPFGYQVSIKGNSLSDVDLEWDTEKIQMLISTYVKNLPILFYGTLAPIERIWRQAGTYVAKDLKIRPTKKRSLPERFRSYIMISSWLSFLEVIQSVYHVPEAEMNEFRSRILNDLLPGCSLSSNKTIVPTKTPQQVFETLLQQLLTKDTLPHFFKVPACKKPIWLEFHLDGTPIWGYLKKYDWNNEEGDTDCVVFIRDTLLNIAKEVAPDLADFSGVLTQIKKESPAYLHKSPNARILRDGQENSKTETAFRLKIEALPIADEVKQALRKQLE